MRDILAELEKPGRDPRPGWRSATFEDGVEELTDLQPGMKLEGVVTDVTNFGAFVDVGVHQDGLVHVSRLSERFVEDPREVVMAGQVVQVKVREIDVARRRVALTMRMHDEPGKPPQRGGGGGPERRAPQSPAPQRPARAEPQVRNAFAQALDKLERHTDGS